MICRTIAVLFLGYYLIAIFLLAVGTFGWFGAAKDPLSGIFLLPAGLPWNMAVNDAPEAVRLWTAILAPLLNLAILTIVCRLTGRTGRR